MSSFRHLCLVLIILGTIFLIPGWLWIIDNLVFMPCLFVLFFWCLFVFFPYGRTNVLEFIRHFSKIGGSLQDEGFFGIFFDVSEVPRFQMSQVYVPHSQTWHSSRIPFQRLVPLVPLIHPVLQDRRHGVILYITLVSRPLPSYGDSSF